MIAPRKYGDAVRVRFTKWGGGAHWEMTGEYLGADEYGHWVGARPPTVMTRPGRTATFDRHLVGLFPHDAWWAATFYEWADFPGSFDVYVDISTVATWTDSEVTLVDLDLDVVREWGGNVFVDDEDEFAEHRIALGYPAEVSAAAEAACAAVLAAVSARAEPFGEVGRGWLERFQASAT